MTAELVFERLRGAAVDFSTPVVLVDDQFRVQWVNVPLQQLLGRDAGEMLHCDVRSFRADDRPLSPERLSRFTSEYIDAFGDVVETQTTVIPLYDGPNWIGHVLLESPLNDQQPDSVSILRESLRSTESLLKESQLLYKALYENSTDLIQSTNTRGELMFVNDTWRRVMGYTEREASRLTMADVLVDEALLPVFHGESEPPTGRLRLKLLTRSGDALWVEGRVSFRYVDGRVVGTHAILSDITERERLERMKEQFVAMVNHELRTPLTSIVGALNLLRDGVVPLDPKARRFVDIALRNADRLTTLVQEVLDFEKLAAGKLEIKEEPVEMKGFLVGLREDYSGLATGHKVEIDAPEVEGLVLHTDPAILRHVVGNFLANAIRFAGSVGKVRFGLTPGRGVVRVWVYDQGRGLGIPFRAAAFRPFEQDRDTSGGTGLGLSIAASMAERLGAQVGFVSITGVGTTFFVDLPAEVDVPHPEIDVDAYEPAELVLAAGRTPNVRIRIGSIDGREELLDELGTSCARMTILVPPELADRSPANQRVEIVSQKAQK